MKIFAAAATLILLVNCSSKGKEHKQVVPRKVISGNPQDFNATINVIHVLVALCDNTYQGIVPVPAAIGNGQDPAKNLYWGCSFGIKSYFKKSSHWQLVQSAKVDSTVLERLVFKHKTKNCYLVADAYDGRYIKDCTGDFFNSCAGVKKEVLEIAGQKLGINGNSALVCYIGHDGLMDFNLPDEYMQTDSTNRKTIMLACFSKHYFGKKLKATGADPLLWSTGLMSPEAYTLHDAIEAYLNGESRENIRNAGAAAYSTYQKCSLKAAKNLLVSGW